jgi:glycosyltransferase involved in cell wall biosynthesis
MKKISIISPTFNEEENILVLYSQVCEVLDKLPQYEFELLYIDNASIDKTTNYLRKLAADDPRVKVIFNNRNFGHIRSPYWGILQTSGDATIYLAADLQDPPSLIPEFIRIWEAGSQIVLAVKPESQTGFVMHFLRKQYYNLLDLISEVKIVLDEVRRIGDPYPFLRGLICELGYTITTIPFMQPRRHRGITKNNFFTLYDIAILGIVRHSAIPIRLVGIVGFLTSSICFILAVFFLVFKLIWWEYFPMGYAPVMILISFMFGVIMAALGLIGEYIYSIHRYVQNRPIIVERERINF